MSTPIDDDFTELRDADIPRVDLVDKAANGTRFLMAKQADGAHAGLMDPGFVRELIGKSAPNVAREETVTMSGSPAAIFKLIHEAAVRKAKYDADDLRRMAANGQAMPDESYPIADRDDLDNAIRAVGRGGADHDAIRRHVIARAKALGAKSEIPDNWNADGSLAGDVAKEMDMDDDALDPMIALAEVDGDMPGMDTDPGSPAWEAVDAATACKWTAILARAQNAIELLAEREMLEAASADPDDIENAWDLQDACSAIDYAISVLAPFAVAEQAEADCGSDMQTVGKALIGFDPTPLDTIEALGRVAKAGRVLSTANEQAIRHAVDSLQKVLASLPAAPIEKDSGQGVAKTANEEPNMPKRTLSEDVTDSSGQEPAMGTAEAEPKPVEKAGGDGGKQEVVVVYDQKGRLVGIVDPGDITPVANAEADPDDMDGSGADSSDGQDGDSDEPSDDDTTQTPDLEPQPSAQAGTAADAVPDDDAVTKQTTDTDMFKSIAKDEATAALDVYSATQEQVIAKQAADLAQLANTVETLAQLVKALEEQPAAPRVFTNGAVPPRDLRGMDRGSQPVDVAHARELKKGLYGGPIASEQNRIATEMQQMAIDRLQEIHHGGARQ